MKTNLRPQHRVNSGFSLVEIVVAVGIVATVMVALLGMIPTGLNTVNEAADKMAEIRIAQQMLGEVQMTPWKDRNTWSNKLMYFDGEGSRLETKDPLKLRFTCRVEVGKAKYKLPKYEPEFEWVDRVVVKIANKRGGGSIDWTDEAPRGEYNSYSTLSVKTRSSRDEDGF